MFSDNEIKAIADKIVKLNLSTLCVFLLEAHLPLSGIIYNLSLAGAPFFSTFRGYQYFSAFFENRNNVEKLIQELSNNAAR